MADSKYNKIIYAGETLIDLTADTVTANTLLKDQTAHAANGETITGTCTFDVDSTDATAAVAEILTGKTAYVRGAKLTGTMPNIGGATMTLSDLNTSTIAQGYHDGSGTVAISDTEKAKIIAGNIKMGVEILGVTGTLEPSSEVTAQAKTVTPGKEAVTVLPDEGTDYLSQVTVNAIPYIQTENSAGGITVTIANQAA